MLRFATNQTSRALFRSRTIPRVAQSVRHQSAGVTEEAMGVFPTIAMMGTTVVLGGSILEQQRWDKNKIEIKQKKIEIEQKIIQIEQEETERESTKDRAKNTDQMSDKWSAIDRSREAVLNKCNKSNWYFSPHKLLGMANKSKANKATRAPKSVVEVIQFFLRWKFHHDNKTIDSVDLKKYLGSEFDTIHDILTEIRDEEAQGWHQADFDNMNEVVDFLDEIFEMKMD